MFKYYFDTKGGGGDLKLLLEIRTKYWNFRFLIPFYITGTKDFILLSGSSLSGATISIVDSANSKNRIKE